eukprot:TRINITY_DN32561_c0_g1_i1.p2 TRINITY_DN32561_c0_g1~~TRINITY_DN32561_c0_g1_i1.p2  ORF type:complete len:114 (+),score=32.04 TRINITY_DN32561_c0_g1_i1:39-380(+)
MAGGWVTCGVEYAVLPALVCPYLYISEYYGLAGSLLAGALVTALCAFLALWRGEMLRRQAVSRAVLLDRLDPVYPSFVGVFLCSLTGLQVTLGVTHWSYFRDGHPFAAFGQGL